MVRVIKLMRSLLLVLLALCVPAQGLKAATMPLCGNLANAVDAQAKGKREAPSARRPLAHEPCHAGGSERIASQGGDRTHKLALSPHDSQKQDPCGGCRQCRACQVCASPALVGSSQLLPPDLVFQHLPAPEFFGGVRPPDRLFRPPLA